MKKQLLVISAMTLMATACYVPAFSQEAKKIQDNSFLIEEAYNQEDGVVQHIQAFQLMKDETWAYSFTQEWPISMQAHQLSYTIPANYNEISESGIGDVALNYRYQLVFKGDIALSPRLSLLLLAGNHKKGLGSGAAGFQINVPLSIELADKWVTHWNMGSTFIPNSKKPNGEQANAFGFNFGASFIFLLSQNINLVCESVWNSDEAVQPDGKKVRDDSFFINPGVRLAINFRNGLQIVPGIAVPVGLGPSENAYGVFAYLSFEHPF